jgi:benzodiazapine receptor
MGLASFRVWHVGGGFCGEAKYPLLIYGLQLILNWLWTPLFFIINIIGWAFVEMTILWVVAVAMTILFFKIDKIAGVLLVPYIAWITFAATLNFTFWYLN